MLRYYTAFDAKDYRVGIADMFMMLRQISTDLGHVESRPSVKCKIKECSIVGPQAPHLWMAIAPPGFALARHSHEDVAPRMQWKSKRFCRISKMSLKGDCEDTCE